MNECERRKIFLYLTDLSLLDEKITTLYVEKQKIDLQSQNDFIRSKLINNKVYF